MSSGGPGLPAAMLVDLDDTVLASSHYADRCLRSVCEWFSPQVDGHGPEALYGAIKQQMEWFWSDPARHREGRLSLDFALPGNIGAAFSRLGIEGKAALVDEIESGRGEVPPYDSLPVPPEWVRVMNESVSASVSGTLVVWSNLDQVNEKRAETVMRHMEQEVGRIYRHFMAEGSVDIQMSRFDANMHIAIISREVRPNDPMYLMSNSATPSEEGDPWSETPMFAERTDSPRYYSVRWDDKEYTVTVRYSKTKDDAHKLGPTGLRAGNLLHGRHVGRNTGISVVREGRELVTLLPMV